VRIDGGRHGSSTDAAAVSLLSDVESYELVNALRANRHVRALELSRCLPGYDGEATWVPAFLEALMCGGPHPSLRRLGLDVTADGLARSLARAMLMLNEQEEWSSWLDELELFLPSVNDSAFGADGEMALAEGLVATRTLMLLKVNSGYSNTEQRVRLLHPRALQAIESALKRGSTFRSLSLARCQLPDRKDVASLAAGVLANTFLLELDVSNCSITSKGARKLANVLRSTRTLEKLNVADNSGIGPSGGRAIGRALKKSHLRELNISNSSLRDAGAKAIADGLVGNKFLMKLNLSRNGIGLYGSDAIVAAIRRNFSMTALSLRGNGWVAQRDLEWCLLSGNCALEELALSDYSQNASVMGQIQDSFPPCRCGSGFEAETGGCCNWCSLERRHSIRISDVASVPAANGKSLRSDMLASDLETIIGAWDSLTDRSLHDAPIDRHLRVFVLCQMNRLRRQIFQRAKEEADTIPLGLWPRVLGLVSGKRDLLRGMLKVKPEICRRPGECVDFDDFVPSLGLASCVLS